MPAPHTVLAPLANRVPDALNRNAWSVVFPNTNRLPTFPVQVTIYLSVAFAIPL
jgi:hypothetical protein